MCASWLAMADVLEAAIVKHFGSVSSWLAHVMHQMSLVEVCIYLVLLPLHGAVLVLN
jgi:hypothetical protein